jgi:predicted DNA-binding transcriptional regulator YafY
MTATSGRLLKLLSLLQTRRDWPGEELARRLEVSGRTIRRDIERLRDLGYPVDALTGPAGGYRLHAGTAMPPLLLDDDEAVAIAVGLRTAARASVTGIEETSVRALVKLEQVLPSHLRRRVNALQTATVTLAASGPTVDPETLTAIAGASRDRERLRFDYRGRDATESRRCVEPHTLVNLGRRWYLVAWDCDREDWRTFRVDRLERLSPAGTRFAHRDLPTADAAAYVAANLSGAPSRYQARVTLHVPAEEVAERWLFTGSSVEPIDDRTCELRTSDDSLDWLAVRVAMLGVDFEVHEPDELVERVRELAARFERASAAAR